MICTPMLFGLRFYAGVIAGLCIISDRAESQDRWSLAVAAGPADAGTGFVGHGGVRLAPRGVASWEAFRTDLTIGQRGGYRVGAATFGIEVGPPAVHTGGVRLYGFLGYTVVWTDDSVGPVGTAGAGARTRWGPVWLTAEQRFQPAFSPLLIGVCF